MVVRGRVRRRDETMQLQAIEVSLPDVTADPRRVRTSGAGVLASIADAGPKALRRSLSRRSGAVCAVAHAEPDRARDPGAADPAVAVRVLREVLLVEVLGVPELGALTSMTFDSTATLAEGTSSS